MPTGFWTNTGFLWAAPSNTHHGDGGGERKVGSQAHEQRLSLASAERKVEDSFLSPLKF